MINRILNFCRFITKFIELVEWNNINSTCSINSIFNLHSFDILYISLIVKITNKISSFLFSVLSISPSCYYCNSIADNRLQCFVKQKENAICSINHLLNRLTCVKSKGQCQKKILTTQGIQDVTTVRQSMDISREVTTSTPSTEFAKYGNGREHGKYIKVSTNILTSL